MTANLTAGKLCVIVVLLTTQFASADEPTRVYHNRLKLLKDAAPLLNDHPEFVQPIEEVRRYEAPILVNDDGADLSVRAWRFSYNARGIIEMPNRLRAEKTAVIMVHPWGIDDGQGWQTPEPAGACDFCTPTKNHLAAEHTRSVDKPRRQTHRQLKTLSEFFQCDLGIRFHNSQHPVAMLLSFTQSLRRGCSLAGVRFLNQVSRFLTKQHHRNDRPGKCDAKSHE